MIFKCCSGLRDFIQKVFLFSFLPLLTLYFVFLLEDGRADPYYRKFTTPKQKALILGNSKAGQGIMPSVLNNNLKEIYKSEIYNYSFTLFGSPYGPLYLESVKNKLETGVENSYFIITVDSWSISGPIEDPNNVSIFEENELFLADVKIVDIDPNPFYFASNYNKPFYEILIQKIKPGMTKLHDDGWWETEDYLDSASVLSRTNGMIKFYSDYSQQHSFSELRFNYLKELILLLKERGDVFLIRMPLSNEILEIENKAIIGFNGLLEDLASETEVPYRDFNENKEGYFFEDGLHLDTKSSRIFSIDLARWICDFKRETDYKFN